MSPGTSSTRSKPVRERVPNADQRRLRLTRLDRVGEHEHAMPRRGRLGDAVGGDTTRSRRAPRRAGASRARRLNIACASAWRAPAAERPGEALLCGAEALHWEDRERSHGASGRVVRGYRVPSREAAKSSTSRASRARASGVSMSVSVTSSGGPPAALVGDDAVDHIGVGARDPGRAALDPGLLAERVGRPLDRPAAHERAHRHHRRRRRPQRLAHARAERGSGRSR